MLAKAENMEEINENKLSSFINDCINIEKNIINIEDINKSIKNCKKNINQKILFVPEDDNEGMKEFLQNVKKFGN